MGISAFVSIRSVCPRLSDEIFETKTISITQLLNYTHIKIYFEIEMCIKYLEKLQLANINNFFHGLAHKNAVALAIKCIKNFVQAFLS